MIIIPDIAPIIATSTVGSVGILYDIYYIIIYTLCRDRQYEMQCYLDVETVFSSVVTGCYYAALIVHLFHLTLQDLLVVLLVCRVFDPLLLVPAISLISWSLSVQDFEPISELPGLEFYEVVIEKPKDLWLW